VRIPQVNWSAAGEKSHPESEDPSNNATRQGDLNHEGNPLCNSASDLLHLHRQQQMNSSFLNQSIFFYLGRYDSDIKFIASRRSRREPGVGQSPQPPPKTP
jgi:hypothetical protein